MLEKMKEIIAEQLSTDADSITEAPPSRMTLVQIPLTYLSLLWLLRMSIP